MPHRYLFYSMGYKPMPLFCCSDYPSVSHSELLLIGSCVFLTFPHPFSSTSLPYFLPSQDVWDLFCVFCVSNLVSFIGECYLETQIWVVFASNILSSASHCETEFVFANKWVWNHIQLWFYQLSNYLSLPLLNYLHIGKSSPLSK